MNAIRPIVVDRLLILLAITLAAAVLTTLWQLQLANLTDKQWHLAQSGKSLPVQASSSEKIAKALFLTREQSYTDALKLYQEIEATTPDSEYARIARFNSANLNMQEAFSLIANDQRGRALPLIEVAKQLYRQLLRIQPDDWGSRYNLSRALLLVPDPLPGAEGIAPPDDAERAVTTMRGFSPGMP